MNRAAIFMFLLLSLPTGASQPTTFQSPNQAAALLELYTSEGCSSCPPAESWLSGLKKHPGLWRDFVPLAFHVDYWDHLGWADSYAKPSFTARQSAWSAAWKSQTLYTPGFVWQGTEWRDWRSGLPSAKSARVGVLSATLEGERLTVAFDQRGDWDVHAARLGCGLTVNVKAGENAGRTLVHDFVVLSLVSSHARSFPVTISLPPSGLAVKQAAGVWITRHGSMYPVQAAGSWVRP